MPGSGRNENRPCQFKQKRFLTASISILVLLIFTGCTSRTAPTTILTPVGVTTTQAPLPPAPPTITAQPGLTPSPSTTSTPVPVPTAEPATRPAPAPVASPTFPAGPDAQSVPELVWLPFGFGDYGEPLVTIRRGAAGFEAAPVPIELFFDYQPGRGIAYGSQFWSAAANGVDSVTDLWLYRASEGAIQLIESGVGRATLNPARSGEPLGIVSLHNGGSFDLFTISTEFELTRLDENIQSFFSISPDGQEAAYIKEGELRQVDLESGKIRPTAAAGLNKKFGWVGDQPLWDLEREDIRPARMLWSAELRQIIGQIDGQTQEVAIVLLTEDLHHVADRYNLPGATLIGWFEPGRTILIQDEDQELKIWSLESYAFIDP